MAEASGGGGRPLVAVVTPVYNGAEFLESHALKSVREQTYRPIVHVLVDNASADATPDIMARYIRESGVPVVQKRNPETLPLARNFNLAVQLVPREAAWFTMLCCDDRMKPNAIADMMALCESTPDMVMVGGGDSVNDEVRPSYLPEDVSVFEASNMAARILADDARLPWPHPLFRRDYLNDGEDFFDADFLAFDAEVALRILSQGGRCGFVHKHLFDNARHGAAIGSTVVKRAAPYMWEHLLLIERYGPGTLTNSEYRRVRRRHLRTAYRRFLWRMLIGAYENCRRDVARFEERGLKPGLLGYIDAVLSWPGHLLEKRIVKPHAPPRWPADAVRPASTARVRYEAARSAN